MSERNATVRAAHRALHPHVHGDLIRIPILPNTGMIEDDILTVELSPRQAQSLAGQLISVVSRFVEDPRR